MIPGAPAGSALFSRPTFLMCPPRFFDVQYVINPWMQGNVHAASYPLALTQWNALHAAVAEHADVLLAEPQPALPDMVFTANAGLVRGTTCVLSHFACPERRGEEKHFKSWFEVEGYTVTEMEPGCYFEGEGDALFAADGQRLWIGHGWRTIVESHDVLERVLGCEVVPLRLVDPRFYHLDTCFAPLANGDLLYYPAAFDEASQAAIEAFYGEDRRIAVNQEDALHFACNAVNLDRVILMNQASEQLASELARRGFTLVQTPLSEFLKAGGAAKCLVLRLDRVS